METSKKINWIIIAVYFLITLTALFFHEVWRDEAQAWCIVRDLNFISIFNEARVEGHPMLWYLILLPFAKLNLPVISMQIISWLFVFISVIFFVFKSPFNYPQKILTVFSAGMMYFLPIIARNYALIPIFIFLLAYLYPKRIEKPYLYPILIILLSQTHILTLAFCLVMAMFYTIETRKKFIASILFIINFSFIFYSFYNMSSINTSVKTYWVPANNLILYFCDNYFSPLFHYTPVMNCLIFYGALAIIFYYFFKINKKIFILFLSSLAYIIYIYCQVWFGGVYYQKAFILLLIFIFCFWCIKNTNKINIKLLDITFIVLFAISSIMGVYSIIREIKYDFSGSKSTAEFIKNNLKDEKNLLAYGYLFTYSPLSAYAKDYNFYSNKFKENITYFDFSMKSYDTPNKNFKEVPKTKYYITQGEKILFEEMGYKEIYSSSENILSDNADPEIFRIYYYNK